MEGQTPYALIDVHEEEEYSAQQIFSATLVPRRPLELHQLRALVFVAETGSVSEAAPRLLLTQPAVTRQIHALEEELGGALFDRATKPLTPTALGKAALEHARRILHMSEDLRALVSSDGGTLRGELRLGVVSSLAHQVIVPVALCSRGHYLLVRGSALPPAHGSHRPCSDAGDRTNRLPPPAPRDGRPQRMRGHEACHAPSTTIQAEGAGK